MGRRPRTRDASPPAFPSFSPKATALAPQRATAAQKGTPSLLTGQRPPHFGQRLPNKDRPLPILGSGCPTRTSLLPLWAATAQRGPPFSLFGQRLPTEDQPLPFLGSGSPVRKSPWKDSRRPPRVTFFAGLAVGGPGIRLAEA